MQEHLIILGAGKPFKGHLHTSLRPAGREKKVLDWTLRAFSQRAKQIYFVGGYDVSKVIEEYSNVIYVVNKNWEATGAVESFFNAPLSDEADYFVCYSDIVFHDSLIAKFDECNPEAIVVAIDRESNSVAGAYEGGDFSFKEKVLLSGNKLSQSGINIGQDGDVCEFIGVVKFPKSVMSDIISMRDNIASLGALHVSALIEKLNTVGHLIEVVDATGEWSDLNNEISFSQFIFGTKSQTLKRLSGNLKLSVIDPQLSFAISDWQNRSNEIIRIIFNDLPSEKYAVRSTAKNEDLLSASNA
ncbi:hypothetical protein OAD74_08960, partial [Alphaproteobacteria bacterium]|nr:hypothetical protein [Alphaproteobacteria bacterium]